MKKFNILFYLIILIFCFDISCQYSTFQIKTDVDNSIVFKDYSNLTLRYRIIGSKVDIINREHFIISSLKKYHFKNIYPIDYAGNVDLDIYFTITDYEFGGFAYLSAITLGLIPQWCTNCYPYTISINLVNHNSSNLTKIINYNKLYKISGNHYYSIVLTPMYFTNKSREQKAFDIIINDIFHKAALK